ncbi:MAG: hypothetical protein NTY35_04575 [Planctomycetota bacterium]|nr:hypothetical protein [Planctomycetota bacterium]
MAPSLRASLAHLALLATAFAVASPAQVRPFAPWSQAPDVKTVPEPSRPPDVVPDRGPRTATTPGEESRARSKSIDPRAPLAAQRGVDHSRTHYDTPGDGSLWVRGANFKLGFDAAGATYYPLFGPRQERHYPHALSPDSVTVGGTPVAFERMSDAARSGDRVELDRGSFVEAYDITPGAIEQTFVFQSLPGTGDLVVHVPLASPLESSACAEGFEFQGEFGRVRYGRATAIDAAGRSSAAPTTLDDAGITIRVSAEFLAGAAFPLVIDPVVSTFVVDTTSYDDFLADVAYDATYDRWLVVYEETVTASDHDIYHVVLNATGGYIWGGYINSNTASWRRARCANLNSADQFLVVAAVDTGGTDSNIRGRTVNAAFSALGNEFPITGVESGPEVWPSVGGDPFPAAPASYCVAYERYYAPGDNDIVFRMVGPDTSVSAPNYISNSGGTSDDYPSISRSNGGDTWTLTWERSTGFLTSDVWCGRIRYDGVVLNGPTQITSGGFNQFPCVSSPLTNTQRTLIVHQYDYGTDNDIHAILLDGVTVLQSIDLTILENVQVFQEQRYPFVDSDGQHFLVGYAEQYLTSTTDYDTYVSDVYVSGNTLGLKQTHQNLAFTGYEEGVVRLASKQGSGGTNGRFMAVWDRTTSATNHDVLAGLFDTEEGGVQAPVCFGDGTNGNCPCGNNGSSGRGCGSSVNAAGALLAASGSLSTWNDSTALAASGMPGTAVCLFFQGTNVNPAATFGDGLVCIGGGVIRIGTQTAAGGTASYPGPGDLSVSTRGAIPLNGAQRAYQVWYRNSAAFCTSSTFNLTNGVRIDWAR